MVEFLEDLISIILVFIIILVIIVGFISLILSIKEEVESGILYQYECITIDNETITCDKVRTTKGGIIGTRDDTSYLIKQYKKIKKVN